MCKEKTKNRFKNDLGYFVASQSPEQIKTQLTEAAMEKHFRRIGYMEIKNEIEEIEKELTVNGRTSLKNMTAMQQIKCDIGTTMMYDLQDAMDIISHEIDYVKKHAPKIYQEWFDEVLPHGMDSLLPPKDENYEIFLAMLPYP